MDLMVGFDLDMTLLDTRARITASLKQTLAEQDITITDEQAWPFIGPPLTVTWAALAPDRDPLPLTTRYRELHATPIAEITPMPGAADALRAVHDAGGRNLVVSAKTAWAIGPTLAEAGLDSLVDVVVGDRFAEQKAPALREHGAQIYVGDHTGDVLAGRMADATMVAVATGPSTQAELAEAGATVVLRSLKEFPVWLQQWLVRELSWQGRERG